MASAWQTATGKAMELLKSAEAAFQGMSGVFRHLVQEHGEIALLLKRLAQSSDVEGSTRLYQELRRQLLAHERAESVSVYGALAEHEMTVRLTTAHEDQRHRLETVLAELDRFEVASPDWDRGVALLRQTVEQHVFEEERDYLPRAQSVIDQASSQGLLERYQAEKRRELAEL